MDAQIKALEKRISDLEMKLAISTMPFELKEQIRSEIIKGEDSTASITRVEVIPAGGASITVPSNPTGTVVFKSPGGRQYTIPYLSIS